MSVIKDMTPLTGMAARYELAYNEVVAEQPEWKQKVIIHNFEIVSGHMIYPNRCDRDLVHDVMQEVVLRAESKKLD